MEGSEKDATQDPGLSEAPTGAPVPSEDEATNVSGIPRTEETQEVDEGDVNESHPNEGELEEAAKDAGDEQG